MASSSVRDAAVDAEAATEADEDPTLTSADAPPSSTSTGATTPGRGRRGLALVALTLLVALPLVVGLIASAEPRWVPVLDLAQTELRVRDVGTRHTPLIGLPGRIGDADHQGSHPGPLSFYALAPVYRVLGSSAWALQAATLVIQAAGIAVALAIAMRRGGWALMAATGAVLALLVAGYGAATLTVPWNPFLPLIWWLVVLLAVWSVVTGDTALLAVVVVAGSFCAQTHVPYLGLCVGAGVVAAATAVVVFRRADAPVRRRILRHAIVALGLGVLCWLPPLVDQMIHRPGNLSILTDHFTSPPEKAIGPSTAVRLVLQRLDAEHLVFDQLAEPGLLVTADPFGRAAEQDRGLVTLTVWGVAVLAAFVLRDRPLLRLHGVVALGLVFAVLVIARIFGTVWYYLMLWVWGVAALMLLAIGWTCVAVVARFLSPNRRRAASRLGVAVLVAATAAVSVRGAVAAPDEPQPDRPLSDILAELLPPTARALDRGVGAADGHAGRYLVTWTDAAHIGSQGYGLVNELERRGFDVGVNGGLGATATFHRVLDAADATARVNLATGIWVERWRALPDAVEVASVDPRTRAERSEFEQLRREVIAELRDAGLDDLVPRVDDNLFGASLDSRVPFGAQLRMSRMLALGVPTAVFVAPPSVGP